MKPNTKWLGPNLDKMAAAFVAAFVPKPIGTKSPCGIKTFYRGWRIEATDHAAVGTKSDGSEERFEIGRLPDIETALRLSKNKINRLEGPEVWNENYQDEELK